MGLVAIDTTVFFHHGVVSESRTPGFSTQILMTLITQGIAGFGENIAVI